MNNISKIEEKNPNPIDIYVGGKIRGRRRFLGMTQTALGNALGITFQQIQKYEKGTNRIGASRLQNIAKTLEVPVSFFFEGVPSDEDNSAKPCIGGDAKEFMEFMTTRQGIQLNRAFVKIKDPKIKEKTLLLVKAMADLDK